MKITYIIAPAGCLMASCSVSDILDTNNFEQLPADSPNIVIIITDDQNKDTVGCYGEGLVSTPNIDRIAANGIKFHNASIVTTVSSPSRYSMLTGRYYNSNYSDEFLDEFPAGVTTCIGNDIYLESDKHNMAGILQQSGYTTGFVGKFHNTHHKILNNTSLWEVNGLMTYPSDSDPTEDSTTSEAMSHNHKWWCDEIAEFGFDYVNGVYCANLAELNNDAANIHNVEWTMDSAVKFLDQQQGSGKPFFLWVATTYNHGPAPENLSNGQFIRSVDSDPTITGEGVRTDLDGSFPSPTRAEIRSMWDNGELTQDGVPALWWDASVGAILDKLESMGVADNTIILYIADHGQANHGKTTLYEDGVTVPMLMQWRSGMAQGAEYDKIFGSVDIAPTLLDAAGVDLEKCNVDGISMKSMFKNMSVEPRKQLLLEMGYARAIKTMDYTYIAVRYPENPTSSLHNNEAGKYYYFEQASLAEKAAESYANYFDSDQLYDYHNDPQATNNLFRQNPTLDAEYQQMLSEELKCYSNRKFGEFNQ